MLRLLLTTVFLTIFSIASAADNPVPDRHQVVTRDIDFYGSDLEPLFDTTFEACQRACFGNAACNAFTFNSRSNACYPKSSVSERQAYDGAISAELLTTDPRILAGAQDRAAELSFLTDRDLGEARALAMDIG